MKKNYYQITGKNKVSDETLFKMFCGLNGEEKIYIKPIYRISNDAIGKLELHIVIEVPDED